MVIQWRNRWSGETGYVKSISVKHGYFTNTFSFEEAHKYGSKSAVSKALKDLEKFGETINNEFIVIE